MTVRQPAQSLYQILGVASDASHAVISEAVKRQRRLNGTGRAAHVEDDRLQGLEIAAAVLLDRDRRARYDATGYYDRRRDAGAEIKPLSQALQRDIARRFRVQTMHPLVRDVAAARLLGRSVYAQDGKLWVGRRPADDATGGLPPVPWNPAANPAQLAAVEEGRRISTEVKHHGVWVAWVCDLNDEREHMVSGSTRADAALRCALTQAHGPVMSLRQDDLDWASVVDAARAAGSGVQRLLDGAMLPFEAWQTFQFSYEGRDELHWGFEPIVVEHVKSGHVVARDPRGGSVLLPLELVCLTPEHAFDEIRRQRGGQEVKVLGSREDDDGSAPAPRP